MHDLPLGFELLHYHMLAVNVSIFDTGLILVGFTEGLEKIPVLDLLQKSILKPSVSLDTKMLVNLSTKVKQNPVVLDVSINLNPLLFQHYFRKPIKAVSTPSSFQTLVLFRLCFLGF